MEIKRCMNKMRKNARESSTQGAKYTMNMAGKKIASAANEWNGEKREDARGCEWAGERASEREFIVVYSKDSNGRMLIFFFQVFSRFFFQINYIHPISLTRCTYLWCSLCIRVCRWASFKLCITYVCMDPESKLGIAMHFHSFNSVRSEIYAKILDIYNIFQVCVSMSNCMPHNHCTQ